MKFPVAAICAIAAVPAVQAFVVPSQVFGTRSATTLSASDYDFSIGDIPEKPKKVKAAPAPAPAPAPEPEPVAVVSEPEPKPEKKSRRWLYEV